MLHRSLDRARARRSDEGFTLIELLIVIVILGILAAIVVLSVSGITSRGKQAACKSDVETVTVASEAYYAKFGSYASAIGVDSTSASTTLTGAGFLHSAPSATDYTINYNNSTGVVTSTPACTSFS